jgi:predicted dehydrogenase
MTLRVGIISANWGAFAHLPAWRALPDVEVVGICTSRRETAEAAATRCSIARPFWNALEMAADPDIDIVDCGTRPSIREAMVLACLQNRKHVYNAIPFAAGLDGARTLRDAWRASGTVAVVDAFSEWLPAHRLAKEMLEDGQIGSLFGGTCVFNMSLFNTLNPQFPYNWFAQAGLGVSAVRNLGSHALHMLTYLFGDVAELVAHDGRLLDEWRAPDGQTIQAETNDFANVLLRFTSGLVIQFQVSWNAPLGRGWYLDVFGSGGRIVLESPSFPTCRETTLHAGKLGGTGVERVEIPQRLLSEPGLGIDASCPIQPAFPMALSMNAMVRAVRDGAEAKAMAKAPAHPDFEQAWQVERLQEAVRVSATQRRWVRLEEIA